MAGDQVESVPLLVDLGGMGFKRWGGITSEEFHPNLRGSKAFRVYREMTDNSAVIGAAYSGMRMLVRQAAWPIKPAKPKDNQKSTWTTADESQAVRWRDYLESVIYDMTTPWRTVVDDGLSMIPYGFALMWEKYKLRRGGFDDPRLASEHDDGLWGLRDLTIRKQDTIERWLYAEDDETLIGAEQRPPPNYKMASLPLDRMLHLKLYGSGGNPESVSMWRNCYRSYYLQTLKEEIEGIGIARDLAGYPVMWVPAQVMNPNASTAEKAIAATCKDLVRKIKRDQLEGLVMPARETSEGKTGWDFELLSSGGSRQIDINGSITRDRLDILMALHWEFKVVGSGQTGSFALHSDKTALAAVFLGAIMDIIVESFNGQTRQRLMRLNGVPRKYWPELSHGDIEKESVKEWIDSMAAAANGGIIVATEKDEALAREKLGAEQRTEKDTILPTPQQPASSPFGMLDAPAPIENDISEDEQEIDDGQVDEEEPAETMTAEEAAEWLKVPKSTIMRAVRFGKLPGAKIGNSYRILRRDLEEHMKPSASI